jgi:nitrogenase molybdenum-iron protein alpha/beta subunit
MRRVFSSYYDGEVERDPRPRGYTGSVIFIRKSAIKAQEIPEKLNVRRMRKQQQKFQFMMKMLFEVCVALAAELLAGMSTAF